MQMWMDMCRTLAVAAAARLGIADVLATASPQESAALARAVGADATALTRLLRTLVSLGILVQPYPETYALTALGARHLGPPDARILGHVGARGTAYWNVRLLDRLFDFEEIRIHSRREESRNAFALRLEADLGKKIIVAEDWQSCLDGADIMVEASRLEKREELFKTEWVKKGALVVPYGTVSALELSLTGIMDKIVVDDLGQFRAGSLGALRPHIDAGLISESSVHGELGEIVVGAKPGRERDEETILFWHRGLSLSDIALGAAMLAKAREQGLGQILVYA